MAVKARLAAIGSGASRLPPFAGLCHEAAPPHAVRLLQRVDAKLGGLASRIIHFIGSGDGDTGPVAAAYAAASAERSGRAVLLLDASGGGGAGPAVVETVMAGRPLAEAVTARTTRLAAARLLGDGALLPQLGDTALWTTLREAFDEVVIDGGAVPASRAALLTVPRADAVVVVIQAGRTRFGPMGRLMADLAEIRAPLLGAVLANRHDPVPVFLRSRL